MEEEDWDAPANDAPKTSSSQQSSTSTLQQQTLKITDGYKYSYEALASPANVDDWIDPPSFSISRRSSNGFSQNSFRDRDNREKSFRNERGDNFKSNRFEKRSNAYTNSSEDFQAPKSRFSNNVRPNPRPVEDWDAPTDTVPNHINRSWSANVNVPIAPSAEESWDVLTRTPQNHKSTPQAVAAVEEEDWDAPAGTSSKIEKPSVEPTYRSSSSLNTPIHPAQNESFSMLESNPPVVNNDEENWDDEPSGSQEKPVTVMPTYNPSLNSSQASIPTHDEENWDAEPNQSSTSAENGFGKAIPTYQSSSNDDQSYSGNQRYDGWQSNKYPRSRNYDSNDPFTRESFNRHSRGNYRQSNTYDRGSRGSRGGRGTSGRGNRDHRDSPFNSFYHSRDSSRNRSDRGERSYQNSYSKGDRQPYQQPVSYNTVVEPEEDWDSPTGFAEKKSEKSMPPPAQMTPIITGQSATPVAEEESWD